MPYQIWFKEKGILEWLQTDMVFLGNYTTLKTHEMEASIFGYLLPITGIFNPETHRLKFDNLDYRPRFKVPDLLMEESSDLKHWSEAILSTVRNLWSMNGLKGCPLKSKKKMGIVFIE